jgi:predicted PurR-regulated permease PerM
MTEPITDIPQGLPPWIPRLLVLVVATVLGTWAAVWVVLTIRGLLITLLLSLFVSFALEPAVQYLARRGWRRGAATGVVFVGVGLVAVLFVGVTLPPLVLQTARLVGNVPMWLTDLSHFLDSQLGIDVNLANVSSSVGDLQSAIQNYASSLASGVLGFGGAVVGVLFQLLTMALFTFYLLADGPKVRRSVLSVIRPNRQEALSQLWEIAIEKTGGYVYSRGLLALSSALFTWVALRVIGVPFALPLSIWVGVISQFIPAIGTYLAAVVPVLVALTNEPIDALWVLGSLVVYQQIENYLLAPRITATTMSMHPAVAFASAIAGASILGVVGAMIALPVAATIQAFVSTYLHRHEVLDSLLGSHHSNGNGYGTGHIRWGRRATDHAPPIAEG